MIKENINNFLVIIFIFSNISTLAQSKKTDLQNENLQGKVNSLKEIKFTLISNDGKFEKSKEFQYSKEVIYDKNGYRTQNAYFLNNGEIDWKSTIKYNSLSNIIEEISYKNNNEISVKHISKYGYSDKILQNRMYNDKNELEKITLYEYANNGILKKVLYLYKTEKPKLESFQPSPIPIPKQDSKSITRKMESDLEKLNVYKSNKIIDSLNSGENKFIVSNIENFDEKGFLACNIRYTNYGYYMEKKMYTYDSIGNKLSETSFGKNENPLFTYYYKYDNQKNLVEVYALNSDGTILQAKKEFKYNDNKNLIETKYYDFDNSLSETTIIKYDINRNTIESTTIDNNDKKSTSTYKYTFDKYRNWMTKTEFYNNSPVSIIERKINYY